MPIPQIKCLAHGPFACFTRPELSVERVSYEVMTPSAARGILDAILWKPQMRWHVVQIDVLKPIRFMPFRRNEVQTKVIPGALKKAMADPSSFKPIIAGAGADTDGTPRGTLALKDVSYVITAEPIVYSKEAGDSPKKYVEMFERRLAKGQHFRMPCFGCREFAAFCEPPRGDEKPVEDNRELGRMLYDIIFDPTGKNNRPVFFEARLKNGVLDTRADTVLSNSNQREELFQCSYKH